MNILSQHPKKMCAPVKVLIGGAVTVVVLLLLMISSFSSGSSDPSMSAGDISKKEHSKLGSANKEVPKQKEKTTIPAVEQNSKSEVANGDKAPIDTDADNEKLPVYNFGPVMYFHHYYKAKSGKAIRDMVMAHAFAFHRNGTYGGSCRDDDVSVAKHEDLLDAIGLREALPFRCPRDVPGPFRNKETIPAGNMDTRFWTPEYVQYLQSLVQYPEKNPDEFVIVVHIRRGVVTPCREKHEGYYRYLPNSHYQKLIDMYNKPGATVRVITEEISFESLDEFRDKGYEVTVEDELSEIWRSFIASDVVILSRSEFSMVPAVVARGQVVYSSFWHDPIQGWDIVPKAIMEEAELETERLRDEKCHNMGR